MQGGIFIGIYVDTLLLINFFITFLLLQITAKLSKKEIKLARIIFSSFIGSIYSLTIFVDNVSDFLLNFTKLIVGMLIVFVAFKFARLSQYLKCVIIYYFCSFIFLGITVGMCFLFKLKFIAINNSILYFNLSAVNIIICAVISYLLSSLIVRIYNRSLSKKEMYMLIIIQDGITYRFNALMDTGNKLREPFSDMPVIIVDKSKMNVDCDDLNMRLVPVTSVGGRTMLKCFKPDKIIIKSSTGKEVVENAYIALSDNINDEIYSAILNCSILSV